jgi:protein O-GlcNAc transferase
MKRRTSSGGKQQQHEQQQHEGAAAVTPPASRSARKQQQRSLWRLGFFGFASAAMLLALANLLYPELLQQLLDSSSSDSAAAQSAFEPISQVHSTVIGNTTFKPALGIFPRGCKWRDVVEEGSTAVQYEYWQEAGQQWVQQQPLSCSLQGEAAPSSSQQQQQQQKMASSWRFHKGNPRTEVVPSKHHVTYRNLWYNNGRWYALVDGQRQVSSWKFSKNQEITALHVLDAREWVKTVKWRAVRGDTLLFDFIFFIHPTAIGHWWEMMGPLYSVLKQPGVDFKRPCDQMVLLHLERTHLMEWVRAVVAVALGVGVQQELPPIWLQEESNVPWQQLGG